MSRNSLELLFAVPNMCMVSDKPDYSDKLFATINVMRQKVGQEEEAERILLKACQEIHFPIYGVVCDEAQINVQPFDDH
jgi:hypothetical protein